MATTSDAKADAFWLEMISQPISFSEEGQERQKLANKQLRKLPADLSSKTAKKLFAFYLDQDPRALWPSTAKIPDPLIDALVHALRKDKAFQARMLVAAFDAGGPDALREVGALFLHISRNFAPESLMKRAGLFRPTKTFADAAVDIVLAVKKAPDDSQDYWVLAWIASHARPTIFQELEPRVAKWTKRSLLFELARKLPRHPLKS